CPRCDHRLPLSRLLNLCTCGSPLLVRYDLKKASANSSISSLQGRVSALWRYRKLLPLRDDANLVSLGEGFTPLLPAKSLAGELGLKRLWIKDEAQNPTGSFKDRGLSLAISRAKELGVKKAAIPSAGNAGGSLAAYAARAGIEAHVFMPRDTPIANQIEVQQYGARLTLWMGSSTIAAGSSMRGRRPRVGLISRHSRNRTAWKGKRRWDTRSPSSSTGPCRT